MSEFRGRLDAWLEHGNPADAPDDCDVCELAADECSCHEPDWGAIAQARHDERYDP